MNERPLIDLGMTGYDELFMNDAERREVSLPKIYTIPLSEIDDFPDHPFQVRLDEDMDQLVESVKERGVITPITLRRKGGGRYEIVSGHRRRKACELAGLATVPNGGIQFAAVYDPTKRESFFVQNAAGSDEATRAAYRFNFWPSGPKVRLAG